MTKENAERAPEHPWEVLLRHGVGLRGLPQPRPTDWATETTGICSVTVLGTGAGAPVTPIVRPVLNVPCAQARRERPPFLRTGLFTSRKSLCPVPALLCCLSGETWEPLHSTLTTQSHSSSRLPSCQQNLSPNSQGQLLKVTKGGNHFEWFTQKS